MNNLGLDIMPINNISRVSEVSKNVDKVVKDVTKRILDLGVNRPEKKLESVRYNNIEVEWNNVDVKGNRVNLEGGVVKIVDTDLSRLRIDNKFKPLTVDISADKLKVINFRNISIANDNVTNLTANVDKFNIEDSKISSRSINVYSKDLLNLDDSRIYSSNLSFLSWNEINFRNVNLSWWDQKLDVSFSGISKEIKLDRTNFRSWRDIILNINNSWNIKFRSTRLSGNLSSVSFNVNNSNNINFNDVKISSNVKDVAVNINNSNDIDFHKVKLSSNANDAFFKMVNVENVKLINYDETSNAGNVNLIIDTAKNVFLRKWDISSNSGDVNTIVNNVNQEVNINNSRFFSNGWNVKININAWYNVVLWRNIKIFSNSWKVSLNLKSQNWDVAIASRSIYSNAGWVDINVYGGRKLKIDSHLIWSNAWDINIKISNVDMVDVNVGKISGRRVTLEFENNKEVNLNNIKVKAHNLQIDLNNTTLNIVRWRYNVSDLTIVLKGDSKLNIKEDILRNINNITIVLNDNSTIIENDILDLENIHIIDNRGNGVEWGNNDVGRNQGGNGVEWGNNDVGRNQVKTAIDMIFNVVNMLPLTLFDKDVWSWTPFKGLDPEIIRLMNEYQTIRYLSKSLPKIEIPKGEKKDYINIDSFRNSIYNKEFEPDKQMTLVKDIFLKDMFEFLGEQIWKIFDENKREKMIDLVQNELNNRVKDEKLRNSILSSFEKWLNKKEAKLVYDNLDDFYDNEYNKDLVKWMASQISWFFNELLKNSRLENSNNYIYSSAIESYKKIEELTKAAILWVFEGNNVLMYL